MKRGVLFLLFSIFLLAIITNMLQSILAETNKVDNAVYEKLRQDGEVRVIVRLYDEPIKAGLLAAKETPKKENVIDSISEGAKDFNLIYKAESVNGFTAEISASALEKLRKDPAVKYIKVEREYNLLLQDSIPMVNATLVLPKQVAGTNITGNGQTVCLVDTGINYTHNDLGGCLGMNCRVMGGFAFQNPFNSSNNTDIMDDNGHGTHVAGIIGANGTTTGVAPGVGFVAVKVCGPSSSCGTQAIIDGINWCAGNYSRYNISVISMSIGGGLFTSYCDSDDADMTAAIDWAVAKNITVVVASGNDGSTTQISSPGCIHNSTAVGAVSKGDIVNYNRNNITVVLAPGVNINSTARNGGYELKSGTSMATPHVSGAVALLKQYKKLENNKNLTTAQIKDVLNRTGKYLNDSASGLNISRLDIWMALQAIDESVPVFNITHPENRTYLTNLSLPLNFSVFDNLNLSKCWYSIDGQNTTLSACANTTFNISRGGHTFRLYANDSAGNENWTAITFNVDNVPSVSLVSPLNNTVIPQNETDFQCNATDDLNLTNITLYIWDLNVQVHTNTTNITGTYNSTNFSYFLPYEGTFKWNCRAYDNSSNFTSTSNYTITYADYNISSCKNITQAGIYSLNKTINDWSGATGAACINITISDVGIDCIDWGYWIDGASISRTIGIRTEGTTSTKLINISVKNCNFTDWEYGIYYNHTYNSKLINLTESNSSCTSIYLLSSSNNTLLNISLSNDSWMGACLYRYIFLGAGSNNNLTNITINGRQKSFGVTGSGIWLDSQNTNNTLLAGIIVNDIIGNGLHLYISPNNRFNNITSSNNTNGLFLESTHNNSFSNIVLSNNSNYGLQILSSNNLSFRNLTLSNNLFNGIYLRESSNNLLDNVTLFNNSGGISVDDYTTTSTNNTFINFAYLNNNGYGLNTSNTSLDLRDSAIGSYRFYNVTLVLRNTSSAMINLPNVTQNGTNFSADVILKRNYAFVNSTNAPGLNKTANIIFMNLGLNNPRILRDSAVCPSSICTKITYNATNGTLIFNVTGFSTYSSEDYCGNSNCESGETCSSCSADCGACPSGSVSIGGGGGGGGASYSTYSAGDISKKADGVSNELAKSDRIVFDISESKHTLLAKSVAADSAVFELASSPQNFTLLVYETRKFNLSSALFYDISVTLNKITNNKANVTLKATSEQIPQPKQVEIANVTNLTKLGAGITPLQNITTQEIFKQPKEASRLLWVLVSLLSASFFVLIYYSLKLLKKKKLIRRRASH